MNKFGATLGSQQQFKLPNDFKFLVKNRHIDRDFDVIIKLKEADQSRILDNLKGQGASNLLLMTNTAGSKDLKADEKFKIIQRVDTMKRILDEINETKEGPKNVQQITKTPQIVLKKGKVFDPNNLNQNSQTYPVQSTFAKFLCVSDPENFLKIDSETAGNIKLLKPVSLRDLVNQIKNGMSLSDI